MKIFASFILILFCVFVFFPFLALIFQGKNIEMWIMILSKWQTYSAMAVTILVAFLCLFLNMIIGTPIAEALARSEFRGKGFFLALLMLPFIFPSFVTSMGLYYGFIKLHLAETLLGVVLIHSFYTLPYYVYAVMIGYQTFSDDFNQMAWIYGANRLQNFYYISLPYILPSMLVGSCLVLTVSFTQYLNTLIIGGGQVVTLPILMFPYLSGGNLNIGAIYGLIFVFVNFLLVGATEYFVRYFSIKNH